MGRRYTDVVLLCLRCLDGAGGVGAGGGASVSEGETGGTKTGTGTGTGTGTDMGTGEWADGEEEGFVDEDGIVIGVRYIERILLRMQEISI